MARRAVDWLALRQRGEPHSDGDIVILRYETALMELDKDWWSERMEWNKKSAQIITAARLFKRRILHNEKGWVSQHCLSYLESREAITGVIILTVCLDAFLLLMTP